MKTSANVDVVLASNTPLASGSSAKQATSSIVSPKKKLGISRLHGKGLSPKGASAHIDSGTLHQSHSPIKRSNMSDNSFAARPDVNSTEDKNGNQSSEDERIWQHGDISVLFQGQGKQNSVDENKEPSHGMSPLPKRQSASKRASSLDPDAVPTHIQSKRSKGQTGTLNATRRPSLNSGEKSTTQRANSDTVKTNVRTQHSKSTVAGFGVKSKVQPMATPGVKKQSADHSGGDLDKETPNTLYGGRQLSNTIGISQPMKKYLESHGGQAATHNSSFKAGPHPYQNPIRTAAGRKFMIQDAD